MQAFWWFDQNLIAGMARPGFNQEHWLNLPFDQSILMGWLGLHSSGSAPLVELQQRILDYCPKVIQFHKLDQAQANEYTNKLSDPKQIIDILKNITGRTKSLSDFDVTDEYVHFEFNPAQLQQEIQYLKQRGFTRIISLTEQQHNQDILQQHFELHHYAIDDLTPPTLSQVQQVAELIEQAKSSQQAIAVHCLAGIGRTSTMIIAAHMLLGESLNKLKSKIAEKNPSYKLTGTQAEFLHNLADSL